MNTMSRNGDNIELINATVRHCLAADYHVIAEGILIEAHYGVMLRQLIKDHRGPSHVFYLDVPLPETLRRHAGRPTMTVPADKLREWYVPYDTLGVAGEVVLEPTSCDHVVRAMQDRIGPVPIRTDLDQGRFL
ncbi:hypothetical protein ACQCX2_15570 [Propionibacteriaceae bacterium Y1700]|uniref:hypothetical protein n=1 Tax=Microlunatus sp. Y1700 TaxID=3418487 RepID=UPI003DA6D798